MEPSIQCARDEEAVAHQLVDALPSELEEERTASWSERDRLQDDLEWMLPTKEAKQLVKDGQSRNRVT